MFAFLINFKILYPELFIREIVSASRWFLRRKKKRANC